MLLLLLPLCLFVPLCGWVRYMKPLAPLAGTQSLALALLNRSPGPVPGTLVDLTSFSFAPAAGVMVRDVWANTTLGPVYGNFTTRPLQGHETLLLRLTVAVAGSASPRAPHPLAHLEL